MISESKRNNRKRDSGKSEKGRDVTRGDDIAWQNSSKGKQAAKVESRAGVGSSVVLRRDPTCSDTDTGAGYDPVNFSEDGHGLRAAGSARINP